MSAVLSKQVIILKLLPIYTSSLASEKPLRMSEISRKIDRL